MTGSRATADTRRAAGLEEEGSCHSSGRGCRDFPAEVGNSLLRSFHSRTGDRQAAAHSRVAAAFVAFAIWQAWP